MKKGFMLIKLSGYVIIGILAAIALPQYNKAEAKSRTSKAFIFGKAIKDARKDIALPKAFAARILVNLIITIPAQ